MSAGVTFAEIKDALLERADALARELAPEGRRNGGYWIAKNPTRADRHGGSFWIRLSDPAKGAWRDEATGETGDVVDFVAYCRRLDPRDRKAARAACLAWLGWTSGPGAPARPRPEQQAAADAERERRRRRQEADELAARQKNRRAALALWLQGEKLNPKTYRGSTLEAYLLGSRGLDLDGRLIERGRELPGALRFLPEHDYRTADGELIALPCMIALMSGPDGSAHAVHRTWLAPDGSGKAMLPDPRVNKPRKIWPAGWQGAFVRLAKGAGNLSPEEAARRGSSGPLAVAEGIEKALAVALALPDLRVWAAGTLGNMGKVPALPCISRLILAGDNDANEKARAAFERAVAEARAAGHTVEARRPPAGFKDWDELLKGETRP